MIKGLPADSLVRTPVGERGRGRWTIELELMAQLIEICSVTAADHRLKKPIRIPRPDKTSQQSQVAPSVRRARDQQAPNAYSAAIAAMGGAQPSRNRPDAAEDTEESQAGSAPRDNGMTPPPPRGDYAGAIAKLAGFQPRRRNGED